MNDQQFPTWQPYMTDASNVSGPQLPQEGKPPSNGKSDVGSSDQILPESHHDFEQTIDPTLLSSEGVDIQHDPYDFRQSPSWDHGGELHRWFSDPEQQRTDAVYKPEPQMSGLLPGPWKASAPRHLQHQSLMQSTRINPLGARSSFQSDVQQGVGTYPPPDSSSHSQPYPNSYGNQGLGEDPAEAAINAMIHTPGFECGRIKRMVNGRNEFGHPAYPSLAFAGSPQNPFANHQGPHPFSGLQDNQIIASPQYLEQFGGITHGGNVALSPSQGLPHNDPHGLPVSFGRFGDTTRQFHAPILPTEPEVQPQAPTSASRATKDGARSTMSQQSSSRDLPRTEKPTCVETNCKRTAKFQSGYCQRHQDKFNRNNAPAPNIPYDDFMTFEPAKNMVYPIHAGLQSNEPSEHQQHARLEDQWVHRFLDAAMSGYQAGGDDENRFYIDQQKTFSGKALMECKAGERYATDMINARMRMLFHAVLVFHYGGESVYPVGGDSGGYGRPDYKIGFPERLRHICDMIKINKLVTMDVIEGKGVLALVENPKKFACRKTQNKQSNQKKDQVLEADRERQRMAEAGLDDEDESEDEEAHEFAGTEQSPPLQPAGKKRKINTTRKTPAAPKPRRTKKAKTAAEAQEPQNTMEPTLYPPHELNEDYAAGTGPPQFTDAAHADFHEHHDIIDYHADLVSGWNPEWDTHSAIRLLEATARL